MDSIHCVNAHDYGGCDDRQSTAVLRAMKRAHLTVARRIGDFVIGQQGHALTHH